MAKYKPTEFMAEDSRYDKKAADYAVSFIECLSHTKGTWAAAPDTAAPARITPGSAGKARSA